MGEKRGTARSSAGERCSVSGGGGVEAADATNASGPADPPNPAISTGRAGAMVMRSVSIFLTSGRKVSAASRGIRHQHHQSAGGATAAAGATGAAAGTSSAHQQQQHQRHQQRKRRRMPEDLALKSAAHHARVAEALRKRTKFTKQELDALCKIYSKLTSNLGAKAGSSSVNNGTLTSGQTIEGIDRTIFRELLHNTFDILTEEALVERVFSLWDRASEGAIRLDAWILGLDVYLRGSLAEKLDFCFRVYDLNGDGYITKDEMFQLFRNCLMKQPGEEDPEEGVRDLTEMALKKLDADRDGKVSFQDYRTSVQSEPLLLEAFGQILPTSDSAAAFLLTLREKIKMC